MKAPNVSTVVVDGRAVPKCCFLGCRHAAVVALLHKFGRSPWRACDDHREGMRKALMIGQASDSGEVYERPPDWTPPPMPVPNRRTRR